ncbi:uncharacterized protein LOC141714840 [Apium graveolens]|uniref:uncharacterized protein LOC141714840 n=1 Tax=Apium graveolens TaxID=4045 RepID=UPI003D79ACC5
MRDLIEGIPGISKSLEKETPTSYADSLFHDNISLVEILKCFPIPQMRRYDGTSDPLEHIAQYKQRIFTIPITRDLKEACMCKGFGSTLSGPALQWFVNLPQGSIRTFADLIDAFNLQFVRSRVFEKTTSDLYKIVQRSREPLRDYLTRFNREKVAITNCDVPTVIEAFRRGLERESPLYEELTKYPCRIMDAVQAKAMAQVRLEEDRMKEDEKYYKPSRKIATPRSRDYKPYTRPNRDEVHVNSTRESNEWKREEHSDWRKVPNLPPTYDSYGFTIMPSAMMKEFTKLGGIVKWPVKSNKPKANPDSKLWCDYYGDYRHKAYDCVALRKELQFLTRKGYLTEFMVSKKTSYVGNDVSPRRNNMTSLRQPSPPPHHKVINFISGGSEICGSTYSQAKRAFRETNIRVMQVGVGNDNLPSLMFDESEKKNIREPQQDGLVISLPMGNCLIKRILVDNGSAANIMMLSTLTQIGLVESDMIKKSTTLVGFSGETKRTLGEITLPIYAQGVNLLEKFCIIDVDSSYNIIMGRPWIHNLQAVASTYHQVLKFPTPWGAQEIRGDQNMARDCYMTCLKPAVQHHGNEMPVATRTGPERLAEVDLKKGDKNVLIGEDLSPTIEANLVNFLTTRLDAFAWEHNDIMGTDPNVITHNLNVDPSYTPVQQK